MSTANINIQVNFQQILEAVKQMSPAEKIKLNEVIWDESTPIPVAHQQLKLKWTPKDFWIGRRSLKTSGSNMRPYKVSIDKEALADISEISGWYNRRVKTLGLSLSSV